MLKPIMLKTGTLKHRRRAPDRSRRKLRTTVMSMSRRTVVALVAVPFSLMTAILLLADRAPGMTIGRVPALWNLGSRIQSRLGIDLIDRTDIPFELDTIGHLGLWFVAGALARALTPLSVRSRVLMALMLLISTLMEVGQGFLTSGRNVSFSDAAANIVGVTLGVVAIMILLGVRSLWHRMVAQARSLIG